MVLMYDGKDLLLPSVIMIIMFWSSCYLLNYSLLSILCSLFLPLVTKIRLLESGHLDCLWGFGLPLGF